MIIQIDTVLKTIRVEDPKVSLKELYDMLDVMLPGGAWKDFWLLAGVKFEPVVTHEVYVPVRIPGPYVAPYVWPWQVTYDTSGTTTLQSSELTQGTWIVSTTSETYTSEKLDEILNQ